MQQGLCLPAAQCPVLWSRLSSGNHRVRTRLEDLKKRAEGELDVLIKEHEHLIAEQQVRQIMLDGGLKPDGSMGKRLAAATRKRDSAVNLLLKSYATAPDASADFSGQAG